MIRVFIAGFFLAFAAMLSSGPVAAQSAAGGAIIGGGTGAIIGGLAAGHPGGAIIGGIIGGATGAVIGRSAQRRHGHYWYSGRCYSRARRSMIACRLCFPGCA